jgi:hypothetical protein
VKIFEIVIFIAVILALAILLLRKGNADNEIKTAELRRTYKEYNAYDGFEYIECECGYSKELNGIWLLQSDEYWENQRCPCCGRCWVFKKRSESDGNTA